MVQLPDDKRCLSLTNLHAAVRGRVLSQSNVRRVQADVSTEELADGITRRTLIHGLSFRAVLDADCVETGTLHFLTLREKGEPEKEIAATFFVPMSMVKQRIPAVRAALPGEGNRMT